VHRRRARRRGDPRERPDGTHDGALPPRAQQFVRVRREQRERAREVGMSGTMEAAVVGLGLFVPGHPTLAHFSTEPADEAARIPAGAFLDPRTRRRASVMTRALADVYGEALSQSGLDPRDVASVFGSGLGEASTMISI